LRLLKGWEVPLTKALVEKLFHQDETTLSSELLFVANDTNDPVDKSVMLAAIDILKKWEQSQSSAEADENKIIR
jgi:hypothetical protein